MPDRTYDADDDQYYPVKGRREVGIPHTTNIRPNPLPPMGTEIDPSCCDLVVEVDTAYGKRRTCTTHRRIWTKVWAPHQEYAQYWLEPWVEETYSGFGVDGR